MRIVRPIPAILCGALALALVAPRPAPAQQAEQRLDLEAFKHRLDEAWDQMMREIGPSIDSLGALIDTLERIDSLEHYERPEVLPNGDIVIRRKAGAPPLPEAPAPDAPAPDAPAPDIPGPGAPGADGPGIRT
ncbi:MAG: AAA+ family ATPase [Thermohalobaculum sp.]|nr:AAA+ family ATPase [Thermohalobaculum sp.]